MFVTYEKIDSTMIWPGLVAKSEKIVCQRRKKRLVGLAPIWIGFAETTIFKFSGKGIQVENFKFDTVYGHCH